MSSFNDLEFMREALVEGGKGIGLTAPNPSVGAVIVKGGAIIGRGFHAGAGGPHAEVEALKDVASNGLTPLGATVYVTLEPCSTVGRTPPCTEALIYAGISRVVWAADDPNPEHQGAAREILEQAGIEVSCGLLGQEAEHLHRAFFKVQRTGLPWVIIKTALSLDGRITRPLEESQWLTGEQARCDVQKLRLEADAILTSGQTARVDNPRLNYRGSHGKKRQPLRVVMTYQQQAGLSENSHLLCDEGFDHSTRFLKGDLESALRSLATEGFQTILVEAGGELGGEFLDEGLVDEWVSYFAPLICGGPTVGVGGVGTLDIKDRLRLKEVSYLQLGEDIRVRGLLDNG